MWRKRLFGGTTWPAKVKRRPTKPPTVKATEQKPVVHSEAKKGGWSFADATSAISAGAAVVAMCAASAAAIFTGLSLATSRRTLIAAERPWLVVTEARPAAHNGKTSLDFTDKGAEFGIQYNFKNVGKSPALKVIAHLKSYLEPFNDGQAANLFEANFAKHKRKRARMTRAYHLTITRPYIPT